MKKQFISVLALLLLFASCKDNTKEKFERAKQLNTISVYETFIKENYESQYADSALVKLQELEFNMAETVDEYNKFLKKYPKTYLTDSVSTSIHILEYKDIASNKRITSKRLKELKAYVENHPNGYYNKIVQHKIDSIKKRAVKTKKAPPPAPKPIVVEVIEDDNEEDVVVEFTENKKSKPELNPEVIDKDDLGNWVRNYGLQNLIEQAENRNAIAQRRLARYYTFVDKNLEKKVYWLKQAAIKFDYVALKNLGYAYQTGKGIAADKNEAAIHYAMASMVTPYGESGAFWGLRDIVGLETGHEIVMDLMIKRVNDELTFSFFDRYTVGNLLFNLARYYENGYSKEHPKDLTEARKYYKLSSEWGNQQAKKNLSKLY